MSVWTELPGGYLDAIGSSTYVGLVVANTDPEADSLAADISSGLVKLHIISTDAAAVDISATSIYIRGVLAFSAGSFQSGYDGTESAYTSDGYGGYEFVIDAGVAFAAISDEDKSEAIFEVRVVSETVGATASIDTTYSFTTADIINPEVASARATYANIIRVSFSEDMLASSSSGANDALNPSNYAFTFLPESDRQAGVSVVASSVSEVSSSVYDVTTDIELTFGRSYRVTCGPIADDSSNANILGPNSRTATFTSWYPPDWSSRRSFDLWSMFSPDDHDADEIIGDLERLLSALQDIVDIVLWDIDRMQYIWDADKCDAAFLPAHLADLGNPFSLDLSEERQRKLIAILVAIYQQKGTEDGVVNVIRFFLGIEVTTIVQPNLSSWSLGDSELGVDTFLGPGDEALLYTFYVQVDHTLSDEDRLVMEKLLDYMKPAHTHYVIVEPTSPIFIDHWSLGESHLGTETYLHS